MLCLSRYPGQSLVIFDKDGSPIAEVRINGLKGDQVSVGIQAKREIDVLRSELLDPARLVEVQGATR